MSMKEITVLLNAIRAYMPHIIIQSMRDAIGKTRLAHILKHQTAYEIHGQPQVQLVLIQASTRWMTVSLYDLC